MAEFHQDETVAFVAAQRSGEIRLARSGNGFVLSLSVLGEDGRGTQRLEIGSLSPELLSELYAALGPVVGPPRNAVLSELTAGSGGILDMRTRR